MKKVFLSIVAMILVSTGAFAQTWGGGPKAGVSFGSVSNLPGARHRVGFTAGAFAVRDLNCWLSLQGEVMYSQQGFTRWAKRSYKVDMDYVNMALIPKFYLLKGLNFQAGAQFSYLVYAKEKGNLRYGTAALAGINKFGGDVVMGLAYDFDFGLIVEGRYNKGFEKFNVGPNGALRNQTFQFNVGWRF